MLNKVVELKYIINKFEKMFSSFDENQLIISTCELVLSFCVVCSQRSSAS